MNIGSKISGECKWGGGSFRIAHVSEKKCLPTFLLFLCLTITCLLASDASTTSPPSVGMEGRLEVTLPGTLLEPKPVSPKSLVILRIAESRPHGTLTYYDLRYIGLVPGKYDLRDYLLRKDGSATNDLPAIPIEIARLLPESHKGELVNAPGSSLPSLGGYKSLIIAVVTLWVVGFALLFMMGRKRKPIQRVEATTTVPTLAERLRPLVQQAADGKLSAQGKAQLERMLVNHWRERLQLEALEMPEALKRLRQHPEAGGLLRQLEDWLHRRPGSTKVDVSALLAPYRELPAARSIPADATA